MPTYFQDSKGLRCSRKLDFQITHFNSWGIDSLINLGQLPAAFQLVRCQRKKVCRLPSPNIYNSFYTE